MHLWYLFPWAVPTTKQIRNPLEPNCSAKKPLKAINVVMHNWGSSTEHYLRDNNYLLAAVLFIHSLRYQVFVAWVYFTASSLKHLPPLVDTEHVQPKDGQRHVQSLSVQLKIRALRSLTFHLQLPLVQKFVWQHQVWQTDICAAKLEKWLTYD